jgi:hypothetical protein
MLAILDPGAVVPEEDAQPAETNWLRWFGTPQLTASTVSQLVDYLDALGKGEEHHTPFTNTLRAESPYALIHASTLQDWLERAVVPVNELCAECSNDCKQRASATVVQCPRYDRAPSPGPALQPRL